MKTNTDKPDCSSYLSCVSEWVDTIEIMAREKKLFRDGDAILVAVSGGVDSMVLLHVLHQLSVKHHWKLTVAHFNHQLRGKQSDSDENLVRQIAHSLNLPIITGLGSVKEIAAQTGDSIEMTARKLRHDFFAGIAREHKIKTVALAHHADDQVELFFLRLLRGASTEGLAGMKWSSPSPANPKIQLVRPFLNTTKAELAEYARKNKIPYSEDATNASTDFLRNRVRHKLIPLLQKEFQPALTRTTLRLMELSRDDSAFIATTAERWKPGRGAFAKLPISVQRHVILQQLHDLGTKADFDLVEHLRQNPNQPITVNPKTILQRDKTGRITQLNQSSPNWSRWGEATDEPGSLLGKTNVSAALQKHFIINLTQSGQTTFSSRKLKWQITPTSGAKFTTHPRTESFDAAKIGLQITLRHWQPGDKFQPIGTNSPRKLQDIFTNLKVPKAERHQRIIATTAAGEIFWVEGLRISERFKLDKATQRRLKWSWRGLSPAAVASGA